MRSGNGMGIGFGLSVALALTACGGLSDSDPMIAVGGSAGAGGATTKPQAQAGGTEALGGRWGTAFQSAVGPSPAECDALADAIAEKELEPGYATLVARFDYQTLKPLGHAFFTVGPAHSFSDEAAARAAATSGFQFPGPASPAVDGALLPSEELPYYGPTWVFYQPAADFGGVVVADGVAGMVVFAATTTWGGTGEILFPTEWKSTDLGIGCSPLPDEPTLGVSLDLRDGTQAPYPEVAERVLTSIMPTIWKMWGGGISAPEVLLYPRTVGPFDPSHAEYIVILNGHSAGG